MAISCLPKTALVVRMWSWWAVGLGLGFPKALRTVYSYCSVSNQLSL
jgi:hypothetical protein